jgi:hypothetical protein
MTCGSRILMQPSEDRHDEGRGRRGTQQRCRLALLVPYLRPARRGSRTGVFATGGSNRVGRAKRAESPVKHCSINQ